MFAKAPNRQADQWVQIHKLPEFVYFNHSVHVNRGISCVECHGRIDQMDEVYHAKPFGMSFCLECHRHPELKLRPEEKITDLAWHPESEAAQLKFGEQAKRKNGRSNPCRPVPRVIVNCQ